MVKIGIIGGSGLENMDIFQIERISKTTTPYGNPSSELTIGKIEGVEVVLLLRHGKNHELMPTNVPYQANIHALKNEGCTHILATTACGSLKENIKPGDFVFVDQFIDKTTKRKSTFYENDHVCHIPMAEPFCKEIRKTLKETADELNLPNHSAGTVVTIEGPRFGTKAESKMLQLLGGDVVNMSTIPEVVLAREAGICYATTAMVTDWDCWKDGRHVNIQEVLKVFKENSEKMKDLLIKIIPKIKENPECQCRKDINNAVIS